MRRHYASLELLSGTVGLEILCGHTKAISVVLGEESKTGHGLENRN